MPSEEAKKLAASIHTRAIYAYADNSYPSLREGVINASATEIESYAEVAVKKAVLELRKSCSDGQCPNSFTEEEFQGYGGSAELEPPLNE